MAKLKPKKKREPNPHASWMGKRGAARRMITMTSEDRRRVALMGGAATKAKWQRIRAEKLQEAQPHDEQQ